MYKVIFNRGAEKYKEPMIGQDGFSYDELYDLLKDGYDFIVISTFSNVIKVPFFKEWQVGMSDGSWRTENYGIKFKEYTFSKRSVSHGPDTYMNYFLSI